MLIMIIIMMMMMMIIVIIIIIIVSNARIVLLKTNVNGIKIAEICRLRLLFESFLLIILLSIEQSDVSPW